MRCFLGVFLDAPTREKTHEIIQTLQPDFGTAICWSLPENLHLTLKFLGQAKQEQLSPLTETITAATKGIESFKITINTVCHFPSKDNSKVIAMKVSPEYSFIPLSSAIEEACEQHGFEEEYRPLNPHLTLGRIKSKPILEIDPKLSDISIDMWVKSFHLIHSDLSSSRVVYKSLHEFKL